MAEVRRQEFEVDLRTMGTEAAMRKHMFKVIEEITVLRQDLKECGSAMKQVIDTMTTLAVSTGAIAQVVDKFQRRMSNNDAIHNDQDQ